MGGSWKESGQRTNNIDETSTTTPTGIKEYQTQFGAGYNDIYNQYSNLKRNPLQLQSAPLYSSTLDPIVQNTISKGLQGIKSQANTQAGQTANALNVAGTGSNSALLGVLNRQSAISGAGAGNQLYATGLEQQRAQDIARQSMISDINKNSIAGRQTEIQTLLGGTNLLQTIAQMAAAARGEKKTLKRTEDERYSKEGSKSFV